MAVAHDGEANVTNTATAAGSITLTGKTTAGSNRVGVFAIGFYDSDDVVSSVTWGGASMTVAVARDEDASWGQTAAIYTIINPPTGASNIVCTFVGASTCAAAALSFQDVDQATPISNTATVATSGTTASPLTLTCPSANGEIVVDAWAFHHSTEPALAVGAGQTSVLNSQLTGTTNPLSSYEAGAASVDMTWTIGGGTLGWWCGVAVSLRAAAAAEFIARPPRPIMQAVTRANYW